MRKQSAAVVAALFIAATCAASNFAQDTTASRPKGYQAVTRPSDDVILSFAHPGRVAEILVDVGDEVKANQLVAREDDSEEQAALAIDESKAKDETQTTAQEMIAEQKQTDADNMEKSGGASPYELDDAKLQAKVEKARVQLSKVQHEQDVLKFKQSSIAVEKMKLLSPIDGIVAQRLIEAGESADGGNMKALRIVQLDPLRIEVPVPIIEARKLKEGSVADIAFSDKTRQGKVVRIFPTGDASSETILVRVEVPNPEKLSSGEKVFVNFTPAATGVAKP